MRKSTFGLLTVLLVVGALVVAACTAAPAPTPAPSKPAAAPTKAPEKPAAAPTKPAAPAKTPAALTKLIEAAKGEGKILDLAGSGFSNDIIPHLQDAFNKMYGLNVTIRLTPGPSMPGMAQKIIEEMQAKQPSTGDIYMGTESHMPRMFKAKAIEPYPWNEAFPFIPKSSINLNGAAVAHATIFFGVTYNTNLVRPNEVPKKLNDLLNPKWAGKIASTSYAAAFDRVASPELQGYPKTKEFLLSFSKTQVAGLIGCSDWQRIASGEFYMMAFDCGAGRAEEGRAKGAPLAQVIVEDAAVGGFQQLAVPVNSAHPNLARLFIGLATSNSGQGLFEKYLYRNFHETKGTTTNSQYEDLVKRGVKIHMSTSDDMMNEPADVAKMRTEFQNILQGK